MEHGNMDGMMDDTMEAHNTKRFFMEKGYGIGNTYREHKCLVR